MEVSEKKPEAGKAPKLQRCGCIAQGFLEKYTGEANPGSFQRSLLGVAMFVIGTVVVTMASIQDLEDARTPMSYVLPVIFLFFTVVALLNMKDTLMWKKNKDPMVLKYLQRKAKDSLEVRYVLGYLYTEGIMVEKDPKAAAQWLRKAQGYAFADNDLGVCYAEGFGVSKDLHKAKKLFKDAAKSGALFASENQQIVSDQM